MDVSKLSPNAAAEVVRDLAMQALQEINRDEAHEALDSARQALQSRSDLKVFVTIQAR